MHLKNDDDNNNSIQPSAETNFAGDYYNDRPDTGAQPVVNNYTRNSPYNSPQPFDNAFDQRQDIRLSNASDRGISIRQRSALTPYLIIIPILIIVVVVAIFMFIGDGYKPGKVKGHTYTNEYFGLKLNVDSDMIVQGVVGRESKVMHRMKNNKEAVADLTAQNIDDTKSYKVLVKYMDKTIEDQDMTPKDAAYNFMVDLSNDIESGGFDVKTTEETLTIGGQTSYGFVMDASLAGEKVCCANFFLFKGHYMASISAFGSSAKEARDMIKKFEKY